jgi:hypothetical protein
MGKENKKKTERRGLIKVVLNKKGLHSKRALLFLLI